MAHKPEHFSIGKTTPRADAYTKATGQEKYAVDYYGKSFLRAGVKRAGIPHAVLKDIHIQEAQNLPGVVAILTSRDVPGTNIIGVVRKDQRVLADTRIRHCGEPLALVIAENKTALKQAIQTITFDYELLPGVFDAEDALGDNAPRVHEDNPEGNVIRNVSIETGSGTEALEFCDTVIEGIFEMPFQEHAYLETEAGWAYQGEDGEIVIIASTQTPFRDCYEIAPVLGIDMEKIRVITPYLGGAFGGKDGITVQCLLGLAVLHAQGKPVKMWWSREESFLASVKRLSARAYYKLGASVSGELKALVCRLYYNGGAYATLGGEVMTLGAEHAGSAYRIPNVSIKGWCVYTNNPVGGPFRGFGAPQAIAAMEQMMDMLASRLGVDPIELRLKNVVRRGDRNCLGVKLTHSVAAAQCLETILHHPMWKDREKWKESAGAYKIRGTGIACMAHAMGFPPAVPDQATAKIEITGKGKIRVYAGVVDMGQGNASTYVQIAGHILRQEPSVMELVLPDTARTLPSGSSSASRTTYTYGNALIGAAKALKKLIIKQALTMIEGSIEGEFVLEPGFVKHTTSEREIPLIEIAGLFDDSERICTYYFKMPTTQENLDVIYMGPHLIYSYAAHVANVEIDKLTGTVEVKSYLAVTDAGRILNPQVFEQQIQGAIVQGIGYALTERFQVREGRIMTENLATYTIPTSMDMPEMISIPIDIEEETGPFGLKGMGEITMSGPVPAIANAIADGCGIRMLSAPFTGEKILTMMKGNKNNRSPRLIPPHQAFSPAGARESNYHATNYRESSRLKIAFVLNNRNIEIEAEPQTRVIDILRENMQMTGTKEACGAGDCGACTILVDGKNMLSCLMLAPQLEGRHITTIESPAAYPHIHNLQEAFIQYGAVQCGFCTPGMIMSATSLLAANPQPDKAEIQASLSGNLCRCTGYQKIVEAVEKAAQSINAGLQPCKQDICIQDKPDHCLQVKDSESTETKGAAKRQPLQKTASHPFFLPETADELWPILKEQPDAMLYAGGTDMLVKSRASDTLHNGSLVCLERIKELGTIYESGDYVFIGSCCTHSQLLSNPLIQDRFPVLIKALKSLGSPQIRNMGTIGGNICTASPAGDTLPPLYILDAEVEICSEKKSRRIPIKDFITGPAKTALEKGEILYGIWLKGNNIYNIHHFEKVGQRRSLAISIASLAALIKTTENGIVEKARFAWGSVAPTVATSEAAEKALTGKPLSEKTLKALLPMIDACL